MVQAQRTVVEEQCKQKEQHGVKCIRWKESIATDKIEEFPILGLWS